MRQYECTAAAKSAEQKCAARPVVCFVTHNSGPQAQGSRTCAEDGVGASQTEYLAPCTVRCLLQVEEEARRAVAAPLPPEAPPPAPRAAPAAAAAALEPSGPAELAEPTVPVPVPLGEAAAPEAAPGLGRTLEEENRDRQAAARGAAVAAVMMPGEPIPQRPEGVSPRPFTAAETAAEEAAMAGPEGAAEAPRPAVPSPAAAAPAPAPVPVKEEEAAPATPTAAPSAAAAAAPPEAPTAAAPTPPAAAAGEAVPEPQPVAAKQPSAELPAAAGEPLAAEKGAVPQPATPTTPTTPAAGAPPATPTTPQAQVRPGGARHGRHARALYGP